MIKLLELRFWSLLIYLYLTGVFVANAQETNHVDPVMKLGIFYPPISDNASRADVAVSLTLLMQEQAARAGLRAADTLLFDSIDEMSVAFEAGTINLISAPPLTIALHFNRASLAECYMGVRMSGKFNSILLVARTDKNINSIQNMRGKRLIMPENQELATVFLDTLVLKNLHIPYKKLFSSFITEKNDKRTLLDLFFDNADVALVNEGAYELMKELNPQFNEKTKVIASYLSKSKSYLFINKNAPFRQKLLDNYLQISSSVRGKQFLNLFQEEKLTTCSVSDLDTLDDLNREHGLLLKKYRIKLSKTGMN